MFRLKHVNWTPFQLITSPGEGGFGSPLYIRYMV